MDGLTTTSYAVLALLVVEPMTTYQLAKQMERSLRDIWPRAESVIYEEPKKLVTAGLATATVAHTGRRRATTYAATAAGRLALQEWLAIPGAPPIVEFEALLKVAFADHADLDTLRDNMAVMLQIADARVDYFADRIGEYRRTGGPYPGRLPVTMLIARFHQEQAAAAQRWARWAQAQVESWDGVTPRTGARVPIDGPSGETA
ncbi:MAG: PadR family transcriptional regulator [Mycobacterium sp.]|nr:PadR family transcriptional regulator [Mycobacterium sp.]